MKKNVLTIRSVSCSVVFKDCAGKRETIVSKGPSLLCLYSNGGNAMYVQKLISCYKYMLFAAGVVSFALVVYKGSGHCYFVCRVINHFFYKFVI